MEAFKWYLKAARKGHDEAAHNVAYFYERGRGVRQNLERAKEWYARAKEMRNRQG
jgi:TPR repeat protein